VKLVQIRLGYVSFGNANTGSGRLYQEGQDRSG